MKKIFKIIFIVLLVIILINIFSYVRYLNLDTYTWDSNNSTLILGEKQYKEDSLDSSLNLELEKDIGKIQGEDSSFRVWSIKGERINDHIAINGFMFEPITFSRIK